MLDRLPTHRTGTWRFHLQPGHTLQLHITSEQGDDTTLHIDGHDISSLLDYLYDHRDLIYEATHDEEARRLEALEDIAAASAVESQSQRARPILYFDDGIRRTRAS
jgi:hypothetical protein